MPSLGPTPFDQHRKCPMPHLLRPGVVARRGVKKIRDAFINGKAIFQPGDSQGRPITRWPFFSQAFQNYRAPTLTSVLRIHKSAFEGSHMIWVRIHIANLRKDTILPSYARRPHTRAALAAPPTNN